MGVQTLAQVDFEDQNNMIIVGTSIGLGMLATAQPHIADHFPNWAQIIFGSGITLGSMAAMGLHLVFNHFMPANKHGVVIGDQLSKRPSEEPGQILLVDGEHVQEG